MKSLQLFVVVISLLHLPGLTRCLHCDGGSCLNPYEKGCLIAIAEERDEVDKLNKILGDRFQEYARVCNSNDDGNRHHCEKNPLYQYDEVRIAPGNWESSLFLSWILQILLSVSTSPPAHHGFAPLERVNNVSTTISYIPVHILVCSSGVIASPSNPRVRL